MPSTAREASYDEIPHESDIVAGTHPEHLRVIANLFAVEAAPAEECSMLEIGCATGANLIAIGHGLPGATLVGIDPSERQIGMGRAAAAEAGVANVELLAADVRDLVNWDRRFDYIVCHGVLSWVPEDVREAIFAVCDNLLKPNGVAYISYNVLPGFHSREPLREMMRFHTAGEEDPMQRARKARAFLGFLAETTSHIGAAGSGFAAYHTMIKEEWELVAAQPDSYVLHEHLAEHNTAFYFHEIMDMVRQRDLQYLGDATFPTMMTADMPQAARKNLQTMADSQLELEQYRDFVLNRMFRKTLLCKASTPIDRQIDQDRIARFSFRERVARGASSDWRMATIAGARVKVSDPTAARVLVEIEQAAPAALSFEELRQRVGSAMETELTGERLAAILISLYSYDAVDFRTWMPAMATTIPERPHAFEPARRRANKPGGRVPFPVHGLAQIDPFVESLLPVLDGTRTVPEIAGEVISRIEAGKFEIDGVEQDEMPKPDEVPRLVDEALEQVRRLGLLLP